ncbi:MAG: hypothetical protein B7733_06910 [Myxococcales bacterium FL481]|nr:MAG: hypothetical protein B7733_06910 [Myxococcales bacterium FL481]
MPTTKRTWRGAQATSWAVGASILLALVFWPSVGIHALWNVLIPVVPALLALAPGLWRNVCPLGSTALLPRHARASSRRELSTAWQGRLSLIGLALLFTLVPLRHVVLDASGPATALTICAMGAVAFTVGLVFEWKSGWCSGLCPVHPVERLYGSAPLVRVTNAHCSACHRCVDACPDSMVDPSRLNKRQGWARQLADTVLAGGFAGFVWGWFQVPDYHGDGWSHLSAAYGWPLAGAAVSLTAYSGLSRMVPQHRRRWLVRSFAALAIGCYYWYRLPMLLGFGEFPGDGVLIDLTGVLPAWAPIASRIATSLAGLVWLVRLDPVRRTWTVRPPLVPIRAAPPS